MLGGPTFIRSGTFEVAAGTYIPVVCDSDAGWVRPEPGSAREMGAMGDSMMPMYASRDCAQYRLPKLTIEPGAVQRLVITRDLRQLAAMPPELPHGALAKFRWAGTEYVFSASQARAVQLMLERYAAGEPDVAQIEFADAVQGNDPSTPWDESAEEPLTVLFNTGAHPAWGELIIPGQTPHTWRLAQPPATTGARPFPDTPLTEDQVDPEMATDAPPDGPPQSPPGRHGPTLTVTRLTGDYNYSGLGRSGVVWVDIRDTGLFLALRRKSAFSGEDLGDEELFTELGKSQVLLPSGTYEVLLGDRLLGWSGRRTIDVAANKGTRLTLTRDFARYVLPADTAVYASSFTWNGRAFPLTPAQAAGVNLLLQRYADGDVTTAADDIIAVLRDAGADTQSDEFSLNRIWTGENPSGNNVLGSLVLHDADTYRLAPAEIVVGRIVIAHEGLNVIIRNVVSGEQIAYQWPVDATFSIAPGELQILRGDALIGWHQGNTADDPNLSRTEEQIEMRPDGTFEVAFARDAAYFRRLATMPLPDVEVLRFCWADGGPIGGGNAGVQVNRDQARCIQVLLAALADGSPELTEDEILQRAEIEGRNFSDVFSAPEGVPPQFAEVYWTKLLQPGDSPGTWRLTPPSDDIADPDVTTSSSDRILQLAEQELAAVQQLVELGSASAGELLAAHLKVAEARLDRAERLTDAVERTAALDAIVDVRRQQLEMATRLHESGVVSDTELQQAEAEYLKAKQRAADAPD